MERHETPALKRYIRRRPFSSREGPEILFFDAVGIEFALTLRDIHDA